mmetsp:Transcript_12060/g.32979  ORF Transcript_12060/g.32979 Transcript_12060/m.32979 type:complete len:109 (+) Transcript_12060:1631-1957(+)|eukprot:615072-Pelagomonas_calceolata.AAC.1
MHSGGPAKVYKANTGGLLLFGSLTGALYAVDIICKLSNAEFQSALFDRLQLKYCAEREILQAALNNCVKGGTFQAALEQASPASTGKIQLSNFTQATSQLCAWICATP